MRQARIKPSDSRLVALRRAIAIKTATEAGATQQAVVAIALKAAETQPFALRVDRRVRYWVDGLVIGSDIFVKNVMARTRGEAAVAKRRLTRAMALDPTAPRPEPFTPTPRAAKIASPFAPCRHRADSLPVPTLPPESRNVWREKKGTGRRGNVR